MEITREELVKKLKDNNGIGFVDIQNVLYEIRLVNHNQIVFSGACWKWEQTAMPSSHGDYTVLTDVLMEDQPVITSFPIQQSYDYYMEVNEFLS
ncbi:hypothetical protein ACLM5H_15355 [Fredinandcohnia humi]